MASGRFEVIVGCMCSGKTEELIRRVRRAVIARQKVRCFKPVVDTRTDRKLASRNGDTYEAQSFDKPHEILEFISPDLHVVAIDEVHFARPEIRHVISGLVSRGLRVIAAGLDTDSRGEPWETTASLMAVCDDVNQVFAVCKVCGNDANRSQKLVDTGERVQVGGDEMYEARCRDCHEPG